MNGENGENGESCESCESCGNSLVAVVSSFLVVDPRLKKNQIFWEYRKSWGDWKQVSKNLILFEELLSNKNQLTKVNESLKENHTLTKNALTNMSTHLTKVLELLNQSLDMGMLTEENHERLFTQAVHAHLKAQTVTSPTTPPPEQDISPLRVDTGSDSESDNEWRDSVTFDGHEWMIASSDYKAMTGDKKKAFRKIGSTGRYILRDGQPIYWCERAATEGRTYNVFPKGNKLRIKNNKLEYKNEGQKNPIGKIVWEAEKRGGKWNVGVGK